MADITATVDPTLTEQLTTDELLDALSHVHRRRILTGLLAGSSPPDPPIATDTFVGPEGGETDRVAQHHVHLPKLDDCGLIAWDRDAHTVARGPEFAAIEPTLTRLIDGSDYLITSA